MASFLRKGYSMDSGITPLTPAQEEKSKASAAREGYFQRILVGADVEANIITGGHPDETISSRAARDAAKGHLFGKLLSKVLDIFQRNHGAKAVAGDLERAEIAERLEETSGILPD